ncbi:hypothetical protein CRENPOLYSF2_4660002 [Crenothrix polyspora]|uniref:Uncharacterized protein n=1 Tax=Crenothrix polyspora TaxID=360316 RepID=A0A1R4HG12_9GAMM|nr:hypothetical protein CRENPOLYSF2_4660002 [Crenothrix polyspora]
MGNAFLLLLNQKGKHPHALKNRNSDTTDRLRPVFLVQNKYAPYPSSTT